MSVHKKTRRVVSLDLIRTVAALMVVMIHCSSPFVKSFETASREFVLGNFFDGISRAAVPLFVMTSGALLLDERREFSVKKFYGKNVKNLVLLLVFWSAFYAVLYQVIFPLARGEAADVPELIHDFVFGHYHMWYLYMAVGLYLITPFLRCVAVKENAGLVRLFLGISLAAQFTVPLTQALATTAVMRRGMLYGGHVWVLTHARRNLVHCQPFISYGPEIPAQPLQDVSLCTLAEAVAAITADTADAVLVCGTGLRRNADACAPLENLPAVTCLPACIHASTEALCLLARHGDYAPEDIEPLYVRPCDAVDNLPDLARRQGRDSDAATAELERLLHLAPGSEI